MLHRPGTAPWPGGRRSSPPSLSNGALYPLAALAIVLPLFLPIAVAVVAGDSVAGEAQAGTLRYLLARPAGRTRLLVAKLVAVLAFVLVTVVIVAVVGYVVGTTLFHAQPLAARVLPGSGGGAGVGGMFGSGTALTPQDITDRTLMAVGYIAVSDARGSPRSRCSSPRSPTPRWARPWVPWRSWSPRSLLFTPSTRRPPIAPLPADPATGWRSSTSSGIRSSGATSPAGWKVAGRLRRGAARGRWATLHDEGRHQLSQTPLAVAAGAGEDHGQHRDDRKAPPRRLACAGVDPD